MSEDKLFMGLDSSTQGLKATILDGNLAIVHEDSVNFDRDLPAYGTQGGAHRGADGLTVTSPTRMWVEALDLLLGRMRAAGCPLNRVAAVSGSGQQHGSTWLKAGARDTLRGLRADRTLCEQLAGAFSVADSPIWMDSSTGPQCAALEAAVGGAQALANLTGSRAFERFTGNQIAKIYRDRPEAYAATERIGLVSSFMASLLIGDYAAIDVSDGSGMNLMDIHGKRWADAALEACAPALKSRLGDLAGSHAVQGPIHGYFVERYGFASPCIVIAFSGDNPNSLAGLRIERAGDIAISLGTSDTCFGSLLEPRPSATEGHIFANPVDPAGYMAMIVRKNGSLTRESVRNRVADGSWDRFGELVRQTAPGNGGCIGIHIDAPEITPPILRTGAYFFDAGEQPVDSLPPAAEARAVLESQFLTLRLHGANIGLEPSRLIATGGASVDRTVLQVIADVFGTPVFVAEKADSASLGAAYRALHGWRCRQRGAFVPFADVLAGARPFRKAVDPDLKAHRVYTGLLDRLDRIEKRLIQSD